MVIILGQAHFLPKLFDMGPSDISQSDLLHQSSSLSASLSIITGEANFDVSTENAFVHKAIAQSVARAPGIVAVLTLSYLGLQMFTVALNYRQAAQKEANQQELNLLQTEYAHRESVLRMQLQHEEEMLRIRLAKDTRSVLGPSLSEKKL